MSCLIAVKYAHSDPVAVCHVGMNQIRSRGPAEPTSRLLTGSSDQWAAEEWAEPCEVDIDGEWRPASLIYLFRTQDVSEQVEDYPWDLGIERIIIRD